MSKSVVWYDELKWAVYSLKALKSSGPDGIVPALLMRDTDALLGRLTKIFRTSL